ncbi:MAG: zinc-finger domain-containing protein [Alphaproteobacteria bacterium]|nr:zinc-finger domain-containing protein [Alphaproteobacteria bacterium]
MNSEIDCVETKKTVVRCDGGGGPLGHPAIYLNLGKENKGVCPYCSKCFVKDLDHSTTGKRTKGLRRVS